MSAGAEWQQQIESEEHEQYELERSNEPNQSSPASLFGDLPCDF
jgi:hypothetical protein